MMNKLSISDLDIALVGDSPSRICYLLSPFDGLEGWADAAAQAFDITLVVIKGMDWDNDLTPWPAKGVPAGCSDFKGNAQAFLTKLTSEVVPEVEKRLGVTQPPERTLTGVSLSGLFTLYQWMICGTFRNIISLSGSFWYDGFARWITSRPVPEKSGRAFFLLGDQEAKARVKAFQSVQSDTEAIVSYLRAAGIDATFRLVPGNHYQNALPRLTLAFTTMFGKS